MKFIFFLFVSAFSLQSHSDNTSAGHETLNDLLNKYSGKGVSGVNGSSNSTNQTEEPKKDPAIEDLTKVLADPNTSPQDKEQIIRVTEEFNANSAKRQKKSPSEQYKERLKYLQTIEAIKSDDEISSDTYYSNTARIYTPEQLDQFDRTLSSEAWAKLAAQLMGLDNSSNSYDSKSKAHEGKGSSFAPFSHPVLSNSTPESRAKISPTFNSVYNSKSSREKKSAALTKLVNTPEFQNNSTNALGENITDSFNKLVAASELSKEPTYNVSDIANLTKLLTSVLGTPPQVDKSIVPQLAAFDKKINSDYGKVSADFFKLANQPEKSSLSDIAKAGSGNAILWIDLARSLNIKTEEIKYSLPQNADMKAAVAIFKEGIKELENLISDLEFYGSIDYLDLLEMPSKSQLPSKPEVALNHLQHAFTSRPLIRKHPQVLAYQAKQFIGQILKKWSKQNAPLGTAPAKHDLWKEFSEDSKKLRSILAATKTDSEALKLIRAFLSDKNYRALMLDLVPKDYSLLKRSAGLLTFSSKAAELNLKTPFSFAMNIVAHQYSRSQIMLKFPELAETSK